MTKSAPLAARPTPSIPARPPHPRPGRRSVLGALGAGAGLTLVPACTQRPAASGGGGGDGDLTLGVSWWGSEDRNQATLDALGIITDRTGWTFTTDYGDWGSYWDKITTQFSGGTAPDVVSMNSPNEIVDFSISHGSFTPEQIDKMKGKTQVAARFLEAIK